jgi:hypothetical protein
METAETTLANFVDAQQADEDTRRLVLQFLSCRFATHAGVYGGGVCLGFSIDPPSAFEILQNRVLAGFHASLLNHRAACKSPECGAAKPLDSFLANIASVVNQIQTASMMQHIQRDTAGKPIVH